MALLIWITDYLCFPPMFPSPIYVSSAKSVLMTMIALLYTPVDCSNWLTGGTLPPPPLMCNYPRIHHCTVLVDLQLGKSLVNAAAGPDLATLQIGGFQVKCLSRKDNLHVWNFHLIDHCDSLVFETCLKGLGYTERPWIFFE